MKRWNFGSHLSFRRVTVRARTQEQAELKASGVLDRRLKKAGGEAPLSHALFLISVAVLTSQEEPTSQNVTAP